MTKVFLLCKQERNATIQPVVAYADEDTANAHAITMNESIHSLNADPYLYVVMPHELIGNPRRLTTMLGLMAVSVLLMAASGGMRIASGSHNPLDYLVAAVGLVLVVIEITSRFRPRGEMV